jgi:lipopolysaccharide export system protein LptA
MRRAMRRAAMILAAVAVPAAALAQAQGAQVPFGGLSHDATQPVEITSDRLDLDQAAGTAVFEGGVKVGQGTLRMAADRIEVFYADAGEGSGAVERMLATGNVTLSNGAEAAEAERATYDIGTGTIEMQGEVLLTQGQNALSSESLVIDLNSGTGQLQGRVQTIFVPREAP